MILVNSQKATLRQFNRDTEENYFDDQNYQDITIKVVPYDVNDNIRFGIYTVPEATGYFIVKRNTPIKEGDQIIWRGKTYTVLKVAEEWIFNRVESLEVAVK